MVVDEVGGHGLGLGKFAHGEVALDEQLHACLLVGSAEGCHLLLRRHVGHGKLQVVDQHLEDGLLAGRLIILLGCVDDLGHQRHVAEEQHQVIVLVGTMEVGAAFVDVLDAVVKPRHLVDV